MRTIYLFTALMFLFCNTTFAKVWRVNNNIGVQADFKNLEDAVKSASVPAGDTIYLEGSANSYWLSSTIDRKLFIFGTGYFLSDVNPKTQWNTQPAQINSTVKFGKGSKGSKISGLQISGLNLCDSLVTVERCYVTGYLYLAQDNDCYADKDTVRQCMVYGIQSVYTSGTSYARNVMVYNNIIYAYSNVENLSNTSIYFINNVIQNNGNVLKCQNSVFQNNIFNSTQFQAYGTSNYFSHNVFAQSSAYTGVSTGNNNDFGVDWASLFVVSNPNYNNPPAGFSHDGQYQLAASSPAKSAGDLNGTAVDAGPYGGPAPYILSGMPPMPSIYSLTVPAQISSGIPTINISLSSAAH